MHFTCWWYSQFGMEFVLFCVVLFCLFFFHPVREQLTKVTVTTILLLFFPQQYTMPMVQRYICTCIRCMEFDQSCTNRVMTEKKQKNRDINNDFVTLTCNAQPYLRTLSSSTFSDIALVIWLLMIQRCVWNETQNALYF